METLSGCDVDFSDKNHRKAFVELMNGYAMHPMGLGHSLDIELMDKTIAHLKVNSSYRGIMIKKDNEFVGLANCFINFSTFKAKPLLNIHDFIIHNNQHGKGYGQFLMKEVEEMAQANNCCRINLEVRNDNPAAMKLYQNMGYNECDPPMYFWEKYL